MNKVDFSQESIIVGLVNPIFYIDPKNRNMVVIDAVEISRMNTPQINRFKTSVDKINKQSSTTSFIIPFVMELCKTVITKFYSERIPQVINARESLIEQMSFESAYKVGMFGLMHLRETSSVTTSYKCSRCKKTNIFDIQNTDSQEIPEPGRGFQLDFLDYCKEDINIDKEQFIEHRLSKPIKIEVPSDPKDTTSEWILADVDFLKFTYPTIKTYVDIASNPDRVAAADFYAMYDHLVELADFDRQTTHRIKLKNTINRVFNFKNSEFSAIMEKQQKYKFYSEFSYDCTLCGEHNETAFDMTNFFESLKS